MADNDKRLRYYNGQFLREKDFTDEQQYHLDRQRRHNRQLHSYGIAEGLTVTAETGATTVTVSPGTAIDGEGRVIVLAESRIVGFGNLSGPVLVVISYREQTSDPATTGDIQETRFWERPDVEVIAEANAPAADARIRLARLEILDGKLKNPPNPGVRIPAGKVSTGTLKVQSPLGSSAQFVQDQNGNQSPLAIGNGKVGIGTDELECVLTVAGNVSLGAVAEVRSQGNEASIRYVNNNGGFWHAGVSAGNNFLFWNKPNNVATVLTPAGTLIANGIKLSAQGTAAEVTGDVSVTGKINVTGTVDGRDISADGTKLDTLASSTIEGVSNPGGNIDLVGQKGIIVTGNNSTKTITIENAAGNLKVQNPISDSLQVVQDQNGTQSPMMLATTHVEINTATARSPVLTVAGNVSSAALMEVRNQKNEASIRYLSMDNADKVAWHVGSGGLGGPKNFFFWNDSTGPVGKVVAKITPEGALTAKAADLTGDLSVAGKILVAGTVDGRDVSADGQKLDTLASSTIDGVSNPGGNIDLVGQTGITVTGDNAAKKITIASAPGSLKVPNPLGTSAQFVQDQSGNQSPLAIGTGKNVGIGTNTPGCLLTVAGNSSKVPTAEMYSQGDESSIRYVNNSGTAWHVGSGGHGDAKSFFFWSQSNGIVGTITPEGTLTVSGGFTAKNVPSESTAPNPNELKTLMIDPTGQTYKSAASQPSTYLRRAVLRAHFDDTQASGTTLTLEAGFQPKLISMEGRSHAKLSDVFHGGPMGGFGRCFDDLSIYSTGHGPIVLRLTHVPYLSSFNHVHDVPGNNALGCTEYRDFQQNLHVFIELIVEAVTSTGFRLKMVRRTDAGRNPPMFGLDLVFAVLG